MAARTCVRPERGPFLSTDFSCNKILTSTYLILSGPAGLPSLPGFVQSSVMTVRDLIFDVLRTLWAHKLRAFLTMFGIAWGIVSIVLMVAAGRGAAQRAGSAGAEPGQGRDDCLSTAGPACRRVALMPGAWCTGKMKMFRWCRRNRRTASTRFRNLSKIRCECTAISITQHLP